MNEVAYIEVGLGVYKVNKNMTFSIVKHFRYWEKTERGGLNQFSTSIIVNGNYKPYTRAQQEQHSER